MARCHWRPCGWGGGLGFRGLSFRVGRYCRSGLEACQDAQVKALTGPARLASRSINGPKATKRRQLEKMVEVTNKKPTAAE